jgi:hypothetical protein
MKFKKIQATKQRLLSTKDPVQQKKVNAEFKKAQRKFGQNMVQTITSVMVWTMRISPRVSKTPQESARLFWGDSLR